MKIHMTTSDRVFTVVIYTILILLLIVTIYPLYFVVVASFTDPVYVNSGELLFYPKGFTTLGYARVFSDSRLVTSYMNTIIYTLCGTALGLTVSLLAGYALSCRNLPGKGMVMGVMVFTMYFSGGLIPTYIVINSLNLVNTRLVLILMGCVSVYNIILIRSFFASTLPEELKEAALIDGCSVGRFFVSIALPLSKAIIAVIALYLAVGYWNSYFNALIYTSKRNLEPLQLYLREVLLVAESTAAIEGMDPEAAAQLQRMASVVKYGIIVVAVLPITLVYPFLQKHFVQGVMIGALKG